MADATDLYTLKQNDTFLCHFRLRKRGQRDPWNVIGATIVLEWWRDGVQGASIPANASHPEAAWGDGFVPILVTPANITGQVASILAVVRVDLGGESIALPHEGNVVFDIQPRGDA